MPPGNIALKTAQVGVWKNRPCARVQGPRGRQAAPETQGYHIPLSFSRVSAAPAGLEHRRLYHRRSLCTRERRGESSQMTGDATSASIWDDSGLRSRECKGFAVSGCAGSRPTGAAAIAPETRGIRYPEFFGVSLAFPVGLEPVHKGVFVIAKLTTERGSCREVKIPCTYTLLKVSKATPV